MLFISNRINGVDMKNNKNVLHLAVKLWIRRGDKEEKNNCVVSVRPIQTAKRLWSLFEHYFCFRHDVIITILMSE